MPLGLRSTSDQLTVKGLLPRPMLHTLPPVPQHHDPDPKLQAQLGYGEWNLTVEVNLWYLGPARAELSYSMVPTVRRSNLKLPSIFFFCTPRRNFVPLSFSYPSRILLSCPTTVGSHQLTGVTGDTLKARRKNNQKRQKGSPRASTDPVVWLVALESGGSRWSQTDWFG